VQGEGRTIELLEWLLPRHPDTRFEFVIGSDILADLPKWKAWDRIVSMVDVVVLQRAGYPASEAVGPAVAEVSSTEIRERLAAGQRPEALMSRRVLDFIEARGLRWTTTPG